MPESLSLNQNSTIQILVADHGSRITDRGKNSEGWQILRKFLENSILENHWSRITESLAYKPCHMSKVKEILICSLSKKISLLMFSSYEILFFLPWIFHSNLVFSCYIEYKDLLVICSKRAAICFVVTMYLAIHN